MRSNASPFTSLRSWFGLHVAITIAGANGCGSEPDKRAPTKVESSHGGTSVYSQPPAGGSTDATSGGLSSTPSSAIGGATGIPTTQRGGTTSLPSTSQGGILSLGGSSATGGSTGQGGLKGSVAGSSSLGSDPETSSADYYVSDLCFAADSANAWGSIERDLSNGEQAVGDGGPLTIAGKIYSKGLGGHAPADTGFELSGLCNHFTATVGIDDEMRSAGSVIFEVWGDGKRLYQSAVLTGDSAAATVQVNINGVQQLRLVANENGGNGSDHADWADAKVTCTRQPTTTCSKLVPTPTVPAGYSLVWSDEFDVEGRPNPSNWGFERGFVRNEEIQYYQEANASVRAGFLIIEGRRERVANAAYVAGDADWRKSRKETEYTSASLQSSGKRFFQFGRFEMRGRIVTQAGLWPAWWTLGVAGEWPSNGEIDIMEYYKGLLHANVACGTTTRWQAKWDSVTKSPDSFGVADWDAKFHVWRMDWDNQSIGLYVDGTLQNSSNLSDLLNPDGQSPFRQAHYQLLNLAIGGVNGGDPTATTFPSRFEVDYVRVFQK